MYFPSQGLVLVVLYCSTVQCKQETGFSGALDPPVDKDGWQRHLEEGGSNNNFTWNSPSNSNSKQCFQVCVCTEHYADCSGRGLIIPPKVGGTNTPSPEESVSPALIRTLDLSENNLEELNENDLLPFSNLQKLILKKNQLAKIPKLPKVGKRLQTLNLGGNQISEMKSEDLQQFPELLNLDLENNLLTLIQDGVFAGNSKLTILNLGYNRISSISEGGFRNLKNLQILVLEENQLTSIQESVFIHTQNILILELNRNYLTELPPALRALINLEKITLAKNLIERIEENILQYCSKLEQLELAGNPIHFYHQDAFINLPRLKKLQ
ncbi:leucine-rich repeat-containing G-protein coupled receptor 6 isoform X2 [Eurytemora carolleeae]|uniref:leucine-rich repeat-containing G-protein coupled receptor 6 isoform X2 n=1 Tax=Eurytemora carolleeae TaxID=1294199 RepID=UPI000C78FA32|nr:leucine-rich repeat-containing G-protein coupled receptor 6 isoform X2 [Eurytemora carolleeae]|eukprot:XP_023336527.1 leucine-rich repeat-containing G-protein coupled receptor 6-like isoform X2 [Eurytemora affinis]